MIVMMITFHYVIVPPPVSRRRRHIALKLSTWLYVAMCVCYVRVYMGLFFHLIYLRSPWTYFNEAQKNYSILGPDDTDDIFKVTKSNVTGKVKQL